MKTPDSKLPNVGTTIFTTMSALAQETGAVNLGQGFPDFNCDTRLLDMMNEAMRAGFNQYPPMTGVPALREEIAKKVLALYGRQYNVTSEITVTAGATQAIQSALTAIVRPATKSSFSSPYMTATSPSSDSMGAFPSTRLWLFLTTVPTGTPCVRSSHRARAPS